MITLANNRLLISYFIIKSCLAGSYCISNTTIPTPCPAGSYCPILTERATQYQCPRGTFSNVTGLHNVTQCTPCTAGYYCNSMGLTAPVGQCEAGYFCGGGSTTIIPTVKGNISGYSISNRGETCVKITNSTLNNICPPGKNY